MANTLLIKSSGTSSQAPTSLQSGEIAINYADGKLFYKNSSDSIIGAKLITNIVGTNNQVSVSESSGTFTISLPSSVYVSSLFVDNIEIDTTGATPGYALAYNGTKFIPTAISGGGGAGAPSAYSETIGDGSSTSFVLTHNLGTRDLVIVARNASSPYEVVEVNWQATSTETTTILFSVAPASNSVRITIYAAGGTAGVTSLNGTTNEIEVNATTGSIDISLPSNLVIPGDISVTGSVLFGLDKLNDVSITSATPEQFLKWDGSNWVNANIPQINALDDIGDVDISTATSGQFLKYNGSNWVNDSIPTINNLDDIGDVLAATPSTNQVLTYDGSNWIATNVSSVSGTSYAQTIGDGSSTSFVINHNLGTRDVYVSIIEAGDNYETLNAAWEATDSANITINFDSAPSNSSIRVIVYSSLASAVGSSYAINVGNGLDTEITVTHNLGTRDIIPVCRLAESPYSDIQVSWEALTDNTTKFYFGSAPETNSVKIIIFSTVSGSNVSHSISSLTDTSISSLAVDEFLKWNGSNWVNASVPTINTLDDVGDVTITSATPGQLIKWNGSAWVNSDTVDNLIVDGDLTVNGTTVTVNVENLLIEDNIITLNSNAIAATSDAGIEVERGDSDNVQIRWNETTDKWQFTNDGTIYKDLGSGGVTVSDTIPASPAEGDMWYESDTGGLFAYYDSQWIEIGGSSAYNEIIGTIQAKGDLLAGNASQSLVRLGVGSNGKRLAANSSTSTGLEWVDDSQSSLVTTKGDILVGATPNTLARLPVGSNGQILVSDSSQTYGIGWTEVNNRNLLYNGAMQIAQRGTSGTIGTSANGTYHSLDRWCVNLSNGGDWAMYQALGNDSAGFSKSLQMYTNGTTPKTSAGYCFISQKLEGQDLQLIRKGTANAQQLTLSFWVKIAGYSQMAGTYIVELQDTDNNRHCSQAYTILSNSDWEYKTITFPADTVGALTNDNNESLRINFWLYAGSNYQNGSLATSWATLSNSNRAVGQTDANYGGMANISFTGVQLNVGPVAAPFEFKSYGEELAECQRYYFRLTAAANSALALGVSANSTTVESIFRFPVTMRTAPSSTIDQSGAAAYQWSGNVESSGGSFSVNQLTTDSCNLRYSPASGTPFTAGASAVTKVNPSTGGFVGFSAEL